MLYGKDWKKMQPLIKTRSLVQIRTHAQKVFKKIGLKKIGAMKRRGLGKDGEVGEVHLLLHFFIEISLFLISICSKN